MDPFDDLDSLLDMEDALQDEGGHKRARADAASAAEAAASLAAGPPDKRPRTAGGSPLPAAPSRGTFAAMGATEEQELLELALASQPASQSAAATTAAARAAPSSYAAALGASEEQELAELAATTQPSPTRAAAGGSVRGAGAAPARAARGGPPAVGAVEEEEFDLDALLDDMLDAEQAERGQRAQQPAAGAAPAAPGAAAGPAAAPAAAEPAPPSIESLLPRREYVPPAREVFRIRGASMTVTGEGGERVYCQLQPPLRGSAMGRRMDVAGQLRRVRGGLLSAPISELMAAVEKEQYDRAVAETAAAAAAAAGGTPGRRRGDGGGAARGAGLWVERYAPRAYTDLLSDEQINREVVRWLKGWDPAVFGTQAPAPPAQQRRGGSRFGGQQQGGDGTGGAGGGGGGGVDALGRPEHKVILIAGPPGLGKTTLAHICATHCGYRPLEINASDDRSGGSLTARVLDAVEMQSVMGQRRPNCVIIDEIDGAAGGAEGRSGIAALLKIINAAPGKPSKQQAGGGYAAQQQAGDDSDSDAEEAEAEGGGERAARGVGRRGTAAAAGGKGQARQQLRPLMRPIICICNDLYAPALRPLRDVAKIFHFKKPQAERLAQRLQSVCAAEGLRCEKSTLRLLVERTECDIRSCLNTLQFLARRGAAAIRAADLEGLRVGQKDMTKGAFSVWTDLLYKRNAPSIIGKHVESEAQRSARLFGGLQDFGESDLVLAGVHENFLGLRYFDMALTKTTTVLAALGDVDRLLRACHRGGEFGLLKYVPAPLVAVSHLVAGPDRPQLQWPRAGYDAARRLAANTALLHGWMLGMAPATYAATGTRSMLLEVLPQLMTIAAPALRPVSQHLYSPHEQAAVRQLVYTLLCYNLRFCLDPAAAEEEEADAAAEGVRGAAADPPLRFRPAVHRACTFPGMPAKGRQLPAAVRQTVSHEADMEAIRRAEAVRRGPAGAATTPGKPLAPTQRQATAPHAGPVPVTLAQRMAAAGGGEAARKAAAPPRKTTWLDTLREASSARAAGANAGEAAGGARGQRFPVLFKYHEGVTNAVKRAVLIRDLV